MKLSCRSQNPGRTAGFTLIEMLLVMGIIIILTGITVVATRGINSTSSRHAAVGNLMGVLDQARMIAISDGRPTYVVFASAPQGQAQTTTAITSTMWGRSYAVYEDPVLSDSSTAANFLPLQRSAWLYLPTGIAFKCDSSTDGIPASVTASLRDSGDQTTFTVQNRSSNGTTAMMLPYVKFDPTGEVVDYTGNVVDATAACLRLLLFQGTSDNSSVESSTHRSAENSTDGKKYTLDEITLKATTGRARYTLDPINNLTAPVVASN